MGKKLLLATTFVGINLFTAVYYFDFPTFGANSSYPHAQIKENIQVSPNYMYAQLGAFKNYANAQKLLEKLKQIKGVNGYIENTDGLFKVIAVFPNRRQIIHKLQREFNIRHFYALKKENQ